MNEISEKDVKRLWVEKDVNSSEITNRCGRLRESSWRTAALTAMACGLMIWMRVSNFRDSFREKKIAVRAGGFCVDALGLFRFFGVKINYIFFR